MIGRWTRWDSAVRALSHILKGPPGSMCAAEQTIPGRSRNTFARLIWTAFRQRIQPVLHEFLTTNRHQLIERCRLKSAHRSTRPASELELAYGVPLFLDQIIRTLQVEQTPEPLRSRKVSGASGGGLQSLSEIGVTARQHGHELLQRGYTVDLVVHDYGDLCQAITDLAVDENALIEADEFRTLNRCLDNAIADSVTEFAYEREQLGADRGAEAFHDRLEVFAHEVRNLVTTARHAMTAIKTGQVGLAGPTGEVLTRCLTGLGELVERSLADVRLGGPPPSRAQLISLSDFVADVQLSARLEARARECVFTVSCVDPRLAVDADRDLLFSAVTNLLQNAFKFTAHRTEVALNVYAIADRIRVDVEDNCGGWPQGTVERMGLPPAGLGLSICRRSVEANHGVLSARDLPGVGCVFSIDLPRHVLAEKFFRL
jgi:signal transduction histidine kinase